MKVSPEDFFETREAQVSIPAETEGSCLSAAAVSVLQANGWEQTLAEDGSRYWVNVQTGESRWDAYMEEVVLSKRNEGLGEIGTVDDFTQSEWVPPSIDLAELRAKDASFGRGEAPLWTTSIESFEVYGAAVALYFLFLRGLWVVFSLMSLCQLPALLLCTSGEATSPSSRDSLGMFRLSLGNIGAGPQKQDGLFDQRINWLGSTYLVNETGNVLAAFTFVGGLIGFAGWLYFVYTTNVISKRTEDDTITCENYTVFVKNLRADEKGDRIVRFLDGLYDLRGKDWKGRDASSLEFPHTSLYGENADPTVHTTAHHPSDRPHAVDVIGTGIADVQLAYADGSAIGSFLRHQKSFKGLLRTRAEAKMFGSDTHLYNPEARKRAIEKELGLTFMVRKCSNTHTFSSSTLLHVKPNFSLFASCKGSRSDWRPSTSYRPVT